MKKISRHVPLVIYGGDSNKDRTGLGHKSILRITRALDYISANPDQDYIIYLAAGTHPAHPDKPALKTMYADYFKAYFLTQEYCLSGEHEFFGVKNMVQVFMTEQNGWGTDEETDLLIHEFPELLDQDIIVVSSESHKARIETSWRLFGNKKITMITCDHDEQHGNTILELVKTIECYLFGYSYRLFGRNTFRMLSGLKNEFIKWGDVHW